MPDAHEITELLSRMSAGDRAAESQLYELLMPQLRRLAQSQLSREGPNHTLQATELVHRMYLRLGGKPLSLRDRGHFFALAGRVMRRELIDYWRARPKVLLLPLDGLPEFLAAAPSQLEAVVIVDELLDQLREEMPVECSIVELKLFVGTTDEETAELLELPLRSMQARFQDARIWLFERAEARQWKTKPAPRKKPRN